MCATDRSQGSYHLEPATRGLDDGADTGMCLLVVADNEPTVDLLYHELIAGTVVRVVIEQSRSSAPSLRTIPCPCCDAIAGRYRGQFCSGRENPRTRNVP